jgi:anti-sigma B factor antagonist
VPKGIDVDRRVPGVAIVALTGEHETYSAPDIERELFAALADDQAVIVDLSRTEFLDSSVVSVLLRARDEAESRSRRFGLVVDDTTGWAVRQLLEMTGLAAVFPISQSRDDAIAGAA